MKTREYQKMFDHEQSYWWFVTKRLFIRTFLSLLKRKGNRKILDAGCGTGGNIPLLQEFGTVSAVDISATAVCFCKRKNSIPVTRTSIDNLPFQKNSFDLITLFDVLYHKRIGDDVSVLQYLHRYLKPNGYILITDCAFQFLFGAHDINNHARKRYTLPELTEKFRLSGFAVIRGSYIFCFTFIFFILNRLFTSLRMLSASSSEMNIHPYINRILKRIGRVEDAVLKLVDLPFGSSIIILAQKV
jgi:SAM-dependent methyltransferase